MKVISGKFNDLSKDLLSKVRKLKNGETVTFQMLTGVKNPDPDPDEQRKRPILYPKHNIPMNDYIKDLDDEWKHIVIADSWDTDKPSREAFFMAGLEDGGLFTGKFTLAGGNKKHEELYEYLQVSNYNESPLVERDATKPALFKEVNLKAAATQVTSKIGLLRKALELAVGMEENEGRELAASLNWNVYPDWVELQAKILEFAKSTPEEFLKFYQDPLKKVKSKIKAALDANILSYDLNSGEVKFANGTLTVIKKKDRSNDILELLSFWFNEAKNGDEVMAAIDNQLESK
jgi:hypothetical protein